MEGLVSFNDGDDTSSVFVQKPDFEVETISAEKILIATGSTPFRQGGIPFDGERIFDSDSINQVRNISQTSFAKKDASTVSPPHRSTVVPAWISS